ncbi:hypothetical protein DPMN_107787 [Dreissena polymorpha]|uniref:Uncharacterized protein n=1 Tax=Dreissena polymorpha TaxID=45954 RepID=A0A9D4K7U9_DREPO|nr:hypothetical protein DPMN_107787 [Dreissena polymorpha]
MKGLHREKNVQNKQAHLKLFTVESTTSSANVLPFDSSTTIHTTASTTTAQPSSTISFKNIDLDSAIHIGCSSIGWNVSVDNKLIQVLHQSAASVEVYFGDNSCRGSISGNFLLFTEGFQDCLTNQKVKFLIN